MKVNFSFFHSVAQHSVVMSVIYPHFKKFSWNQFSKKVTLKKFLQKNLGGKIFKFPQCAQSQCAQSQCAQSQCAQSQCAQSQCGNWRNSLSHFFWKHFVKAMVLLKKLLNSWFDEFFSARENLLFFHTVAQFTFYGNHENSLSHHFDKKFVKAMFSLHQCTMEILEIHSHICLTKNSWK